VGKVIENLHALRSKDREAAEKNAAK